MNSIIISTPAGHMRLTSNGNALSEARFIEGDIPSNPRPHASVTITDGTPDETLLAAVDWLKAYFSGSDVPPAIPYAAKGSPFRRTVWEVLDSVPYGSTVSYGAIAAEIARRQGRATMSAQAVGQALGDNPICIFRPCHRVVAADGTLGGYSAGLSRKSYLLNLEKSHLS